MASPGWYTLSAEAIPMLRRSAKSSRHSCSCNSPYSPHTGSASTNASRPAPARNEILARHLEPFENETATNDNIVHHEPRNTEPRAGHGLVQRPALGWGRMALGEACNEGDDVRGRVAYLFMLAIL